MPLLKRQPFTKQKPPPGLKPDDEVFHCTITNEIFTDYEKFFERIILCNSMVWSCSMSGKSGLTYQEALDSEAKARKQLGTFPDYIQKPILYLITLTHRSRLVDLNDDIYQFVKDRFFINEVVTVMHDGVKKACRIIKVMAPKSDVVENGDAGKDSDSDVICLDDDPKPSTSKGSDGGSGIPDSADYQYAVQEIKKPNLYIMKASQIGRRKGLFSREKSKLYLKQHCEAEGHGIWKVKPRYMKKFNLTEMRWESMFDGPKPKFTVQEAKKRGPKKAVIDLTGEDEAIRQAKLERKIKKLKEKEIKAKNKGKSKKEIKEALKEAKKEAKKEARKEARKEAKKKALEKLKEAERMKNLSPEELKRLKEELREKKKLEKEKMKADLKKQKAEEKQKEREEKLKERIKKLEEKRLQEEELRQWSKPREDMECDDLKPLPRPTPVQLHVPGEQFGQVVMLLEFFKAFQSLFDEEGDFLKDITLDSLSEALVSTEADGLFSDIMCFLLRMMFSLQDEEEEEEEVPMDDEDIKAAGEETKTGSSFKGLVEQATASAQLTQLTFGAPLGKLHLDNYTLTEVLRLYFSSAGAKGSDSNVRFRYQQRGGYTSLDDAGLELRRSEPAILQALQESSLYDLQPAMKLRLVEALVQQMLTYVACRDLVEDNYEKLRQAKVDLRSHQAQEKQRERDEATFWYRKRVEEKAKEREAEAERKEQKKKEKEEKLRQEEQKHEMKKQGVAVDEEKEKKEKSPSPPERRSTRVKQPVLIEQVEEERKSSRVKERDIREGTVKEWPENVVWDKVSPDDRRAYQETHQRKEREFSEAMHALQNGNAIYPLGRDRTFRRYWVFRAIPGLFVEDEELFIPDDYLKAVPQKTPKVQEAEEKSTSSDKENDSFDHGNSLGGNSDSRPAVLGDINSGKSQGGEEEMEVDSKLASYHTQSVHEQIASRNDVCWAYYSSLEQIDALIDALNPRGLREGPLKQALQEHKYRLVKDVDNLPNLHQTFEEQTGSGSVKQAAIKSRNRMVAGCLKEGKAQEFLELNLRETLLDIEERVFGGGLGNLKVDERDLWRDALEQGSYHMGAEELRWSGKQDGVGKKLETVKEEDDVKKEEDVAMKEEQENGGEVEGGGSGVVVRDLCRALLQVRQMVEPKYLEPPLGDDDNVRERKQREALELAFRGLTPRKIRAKVWDRKGKRKDDSDEDEEAVDDDGPRKTVSERWEESLMSCQSLSQVFLHLSVLENSILWSKSAKHARCRVCRRKGDDSKMLLCDGCDRGYHMYCLKPVVKSIPKSDWYCQDCKISQAPKTPRQRRKSFVEKEPDEEEDDDEDEEGEDDSSDDDDSDDSDSDEDDSDESDSSEEEEEQEEEEQAPAKIKFLKGPKNKKQQKQQQEEEEEEEEEEDESFSRGSSRPSSRAGSRRGSRANTPKRETARGRQSLEKAVMEKAMSAKGKKNAVSGGKNSAKRGRHSIETATPSVTKSSGRSSRRSLPEAGTRTSKRKREEQHEEDEEEVAAPSSKKWQSSKRHSEGHASLKACEELLNEVMDKDEAWPFLKPVSRKDAPDYFDIVKTPMDLSTVRNHVKKFEYANPGDLLRDMRLTFSNCQQYNMPQTAEYKAGQKLSRFFEKRMKELHLDAHLKSPAASPAKNSPNKTSPRRRSGRRT